MNTAQHHIPPHSIEIEESIIASMILYPTETLPDVVDILSPDDFYRSAHKKIYAAILDMRAKKEPIDVINLTTKLREMNLLEEVGGAAHLMTITETCPVAPEPQYAARKIKEKSINRELIKTANDIEKLAMAGNADALDEAQQKIMGIKYTDKAAAVQMNHILVDAMTRYEDRQKNQGITGEPYGFNDVDFYTCGMQPGDLIVVAGRPSMGKSAFAHQVAINTPGPSVIYSLEMSKEQISDRLMSSISGVDSMLLRTGRLGRRHWERLADAGSSLSDKKIFINDDATILPEEVSRRTRALVRSEGVKVCIVDYLQLVESGKRKKRHLEVADITRRMKLMARELKIPVVLLSQLNRNLEQRDNKRPRLSDLRESGAIEQDADVVLMLYRDGVYNPKTDKATGEVIEDHTLEVIIAKQRMGPILTVGLYWDGKTTTIGNIAREDQYANGTRN